MEGIRWWVGLAARALRARAAIIGGVTVNATAPRRMCRSFTAARSPNAVRVGGPLARVGRPELSSRTGAHRHRGPDAAAVAACAATATNMPNSLRRVPSIR